MVPFRERNEDLQRSDEDLQRGSEINSDEVIVSTIAKSAQEGSRAALRSSRLSPTPSRPMASSSVRHPPVVYDSDDEVVTTLTADERAAVESCSRRSSTLGVRRIADQGRLAHASAARLRGDGRDQGAVTTRRHSRRSVRVSVPRERHSCLARQRHDCSVPLDRAQAVGARAGAHGAGALAGRRRSALRPSLPRSPRASGASRHKGWIAVHLLEHGCVDAVQGSVTCTTAFAAAVDGERTEAAVPECAARSRGARS